MTTNRLAKLAVAVAFGTALGVGAAAFVASQRPAAPPPGIQGLLWPDPKAVKPFTLAAHTGEPFTLRELEGRWSFLFFGYTRCPDVCPTTLAMLAGVARELEGSPSGEDVQFVFVSVDPARDVREHLAAYVTYFHPAFLGVTAPDEQLSGLTRQLGIAVEREAPDARGDYLVSHTSAVLLIDPAGRFVGVFQGPHEAPELAERFRQIRRFVET